MVNAYLAMEPEDVLRVHHLVPDCRREDESKCGSGFECVLIQLLSFPGRLPTRSRYNHDVLKAVLVQCCSSQPYGFFPLVVRTVDKLSLFLLTNRRAAKTLTDAELRRLNPGQGSLSLLLVQDGEHGP